MLDSRRGSWLAWGALLAPAAALAGSLGVVGVEPSARTITASVNTPIVIHFDRPVSPATITSTSLRAFGRWSGAVSGSFGFADGDRVVTLSPAQPFSAGESVMVVLSREIQAADGSPLRAAGWSHQFWTRAAPAPMVFAELDRMTTRTTPSVSSRAYGGIASDLNHDGQLDLTIVNEITADLRVFLNRADGSGLFHPFNQPTYPVGDRASPSEPADFDGDGHVDICVANINDGTVSILRGRGDGKFLPQQLVAVGAAPRGIAVLDADGDGDVDVVNTNSGSAAPAMSLLINDGSGVLGPPTFFDAGVAAPWALAAADMNGDGILDLVVGSRATEQIAVLAGAGDGTFAPLSTQSAGGAVWMIALGDVNGDGFEDVATSNSTSNNGSILFGDGAGNLDPPQVHATDPFGLATDLGDVDGDGDLDWVTSSFNGDWGLFLNDGAGAFTFSTSFPATSASSCALMLDLEGDRDLDLALIDEIADEVILMQNSGITPVAPPPGVPGGALATAPLGVAKLDPAGARLRLSWDSSTCEAADHQILFGSGAGLPATPGGVYVPDGARCGAGSGSPFDWLTVPEAGVAPAGRVWFIVVARAGSAEGSWGTDSAGNERWGPGPGGSSGACGVSEKDLSNSCGQ